MNPNEYMKLVPLSIQYKKAFEEGLDELRGTNGMGFWEEVGAPQSIEEYVRIRLDHSLGKNLPKGWIPATTYWLMDGKIFIGETTIRHQLTEHLRNVGGQIGYWIRPSKRKQGYGTQILKFSLQEAKKMGLAKIIITCDETNEGSRKIIEANGGIFERARDMGAGNPKKLLFWIELN